MDRTPRQPSTRGRVTALLGTGSLLIVAGAAALSPVPAGASSHREAPGITDQPKYDNTDVYAFVSPDDPDSVTLIGNWIPMEEPAGGPNYYPFATDARYEFHVDNDGDAKADLTYRYTFRDDRTPRPADSFSGLGTFLYNNGQVTSLDDPNLLFRQKYKLEVIDERGRKTQITSDAITAPSFVGDVSMPDYQSLRDSAVETMKGVTTFAGQTEDPFFLDLRVFDLLYGDQGTCAEEVGNDTLNGYNVNTIALKVPAAQLTAGTDPVIGVWSTTSRQTAKGGYTQVSRLGQPLVNEAVIPYQVKDTFNAIDPTQDAAALPFVLKPELAFLLKNVCGLSQIPTDNRQDLATIFLTGVPGLNQPADVTASEQLRLNTSIAPSVDPKRLGVLAGDTAGFPNGRRLTDDVVDIALQVVAGELAGSLGGDSGNTNFPNDLGDGVDTNASGFGDDFPYVALPHSGSVEQSSAPADSGETLLTGGDGRGPSGGFPTGPVAVVALGALLLMAGLATARTAARRPVFATA